MRSNTFLFLTSIFIFFLLSCNRKTGTKEQKKIDRLNKILHYFENKKTNLGLGAVKDIRKTSIVVNHYLVRYFELPTFLFRKEFEDSLKCNCKPYTKDSIFKYDKVRYENYLKNTKNEHHRSIFKIPTSKMCLTLYVCEISENIIGTVLQSLDCHDPEEGWEGCRKFSKYHPIPNIFASFCFDEKNDIKYVFFRKNTPIP